MAGSVQVAEEGRERAVAGRRGDGRGETTPPVRGPIEDIVVTGAKRCAGSAAVDVVPHGEGRPAPAGLPAGAERGRPGITAGEAPGFVGPLEPAVPAAPQQDAFAHAEDGEVDVPIAAAVHGL